MFEFWLEAEQFYTTTLPVLSIVLLIVIGSMLFVLFYTHKGSKFRKRFGGLLLFVLVGGLGYSVWQHANYHHWLQQADLITPGIRAERKIFGSARPVSPEIVELNRDVNLSNQFRALDMYQEQKAEREISNLYLGSSGMNHYFAIGDEGEYAFRYTGKVEYTDRNSYVSGSVFVLKDHRFESLSFIAESAHYLETFYINREDAGKVTGELPRQIVPISEVILNWVFSNPI